MLYNLRSLHLHLKDDIIMKGSEFIIVLLHFMAAFSASRNEKIGEDHSFCRLAWTNTQVHHVDLYLCASRNCHDPHLHNTILFTAESLFLKPRKKSVKTVKKMIGYPVECTCFIMY